LTSVDPRITLPARKEGLMERREFVAASIGASVGSLLDPAKGRAQTSMGKPQILELRWYRFRFGPMEARWSDYAKSTLIPAMNRAGVKPIGAFSVALGPDSPSTLLLLPHQSAESVVTMAGRLSADAEYQRAAAPFRSLPASDPPYVRRESSLAVAFDGAPVLEAPSGALAAPSRMFELRTYESHNETAGSKKIEMFEKGGEIAIFRRVGLTPVFFARDVVGPALPSLTYMVVFADAAAREKAWATFREDPEWVKLRSTAGYSNADILTNTHTMLLRPTAFSQI